MLLKFIEEIRNKPKEVRKNYAFFTALGMTFFIVCIYFLSMYFEMLGTRPWKGKESEKSEPQTPMSKLFNESNVFTNESGELQSSTYDWTEQLRLLEQQQSVGTSGASTASGTPLLEGF